MAYEESPFHKTDVYEIRLYFDRLAVQAPYTNQNNSFRNLFNYVSCRLEKIIKNIIKTYIKNFN